MHDTAHEAGAPLFEFSEIDAHITIGTNACCETHFEERLVTLGVDADISLEGERIDRPYGVRTFLWLPTEDHTAPSRENIEVGVEALATLERQDRKVYIHCKNGHGRAPTLYAAYLIMKKGLTTDDAVAAITEKRPSVHVEDAQMAVLRSLETEK